MHPHEQEEIEFHYSSMQEWDREEARQLGQSDPDRAWVLTGNDVWLRNPYYHGPDVPHPEADDYEDEASSGVSYSNDEIPF